MKYVQTITSIEEHACGGYEIKFAQSSDNPMMEEIRLDPDALEAVYAAAKQLLTQHNNENHATDSGKLK